MVVGPKTNAAIGRLLAVMQRTVAMPRVEVDATVEALVRQGSNNAITGFQARVGDQLYTVPLAGEAVEVGQQVRISRAQGTAANPDFRFEYRQPGKRPFAALDDTIPVPVPAIALATALNTSTPTGRTAFIRVTITEVSDNLSPHHYEVQFANNADAAAGRWTTRSIADQPGDNTLILVLDALPLGVQYNVRARAVLNSGAKSDLAAATIFTVTTPTDDVIPSAPVSIPKIDVSKALVAVITLPDPNQPTVFSHWEVDVADSNGGLNSIVTKVQAKQFLVETTGARSIYVRIREVTLSGQVSGWYPGAGYSGPWNIAALPAGTDTTPPAVPSIASFTAVNEVINGVFMVNLVVTLAAYSAPSDFKEFEFQFSDGTYNTFFTTTQTTFRWEKVRPNTAYTVRVRAWDIYGNASSFTSTSSVTTPNISAPPTMPAPNVTAYYRAVRVTWTQLADGAAYGRVATYLIYRSTDNVNFTQIASVDGNFWVDANQNPANTYWYRIAPVSAGGVVGSQSPSSASVQPLLIANGDIAANAITANEIAAGAITATKLAATIILASQEISAGTTGSITAGGGNVILNNNGVRLQGARLIKFRDLTITATADMGVANAGAVTGEDALWIMTSGLMGIVDDTSNGDFRFRITALRGAEMEVQNNAIPGVIARYTATGEERKKSLAGSYFPSGVNWLTDAQISAGPLGNNLQPAGAAATDYTYDVTSYGIPSGAKGVILKGWAQIATANANLWCWTAGETNRDVGGIYYTNGAVNSRAPWGGIVKPSSGNQITIRSGVAFSCSLTIVGYIW